MIHSILISVLAGMLSGGPTPSDHGLNEMVDDTYEHLQTAQQLLLKAEGGDINAMQELAHLFRSD